MRTGRINKIERAIAESGVFEELEEEDDDEPIALAGPPVATTARPERRASLGPMELSGFLVKKSGVLSGNRRRYFVLKEGSLLWYKSERDKQPQGFLQLGECVSIDEHQVAAAAATSSPAAADSSSSSIRSGGKPPGMVKSALARARSSSKSVLVRVSTSSQRRSSEVDDDVAPTSPDSPAGGSSGSGGGGGGGGAAAGQCALRIRAQKDYILFATDSYERDRWLRALQHNTKYPPYPGLATLTAKQRRSDSSADSGGSARRSNDEDDSLGSSSSSSAPPAKDRKRSMFGTLALKAEKKLVGRAVTSDLGKKLLREYCLPDTFILLQSLRDLATLDPMMPPKSGAKIEDTILRMACKVVLLYKHSMLMPRDFDAATRLVDTIAVDIVRKYDAVCIPPHEDLFDEGHARMAVQMTALKAELAMLLSPHVSAKNVGALGEVVEYFGTPDNLTRFTQEQRCFAELGKMANALRKMYGLDAPKPPPPSLQGGDGSKKTLSGRI